MFIHPFFHLFVCFFVRSCHSSCIPTACIQEKKVTCRCSGRQIALRVFFVCLLLKILLKLSRCTCKCWAGTFGGHVFSWTPSLISYKSFFTVKTQRPGSDCADALYVSFKFFFIFAKVLTGPYFTYVYLLHRPRSNCVDAHYTELSDTFDTPFHLR